MLDTPKALLLTDNVTDELLAKSPQELIDSNNLQTNIWNLENNVLHLFISSCIWNSCIIKLDAPINLKGYPQLHERVNKFHIIASEDVIRNSFNFFVETFPNKASELRRARLTNSSLRDVLNS